MVNKIARIVGALILLGLIVFALLLRQNTEQYSTDLENEAERGVFKLDK